MKPIIIGTRTSKLALWQATQIKQLLEAQFPEITCSFKEIITKGDKTLDKPLPEIGGKGLFTAELESMLRHGRIDLAVHSLKDLPIDDAPGTTVGAICQRADVRDVLIAQNGETLYDLPHGAVIGTSSLRRKAQLLAHRPDLDVRSIRGNVDTRIAKVRRGDYDAIVLAAAGVSRLGLNDNISDRLPTSLMLPAPGQGALAVQCRANDEACRTLLAAIDDATVRACVTAERAFLASLGSGCSLPVAALATTRKATIHLTGLVAAEDGQRMIRVSGNGRHPQQLGAKLAQQAKAQGAEALLL